MALTEDLNIYRSMYNLLRLLIQARNNFDKSYKYVVGDRLVDTALNCVTLIHYANEDRRKGAREEHLDKFLIEFDILKTLIMVCRDERQYKKDSVLADVFVHVADVENQATAWRRSAARKPESQ
ncbi:MAG: four helix bundle protein [Muribaculaceae bacterium]|nr:four helix bundle protein [Muribaculaceae bacterium]